MTKAMVVKNNDTTTYCSGRDDIYLQLLDILKLANKHELKVIYMFIISLLKIGR